MKYSRNALNCNNPLTWLGVLLLAWLALGVQLAAPNVASGPFYAATEHHLGVTRWEAAPRLGLDAWTTKSTSGVTVAAKGAASTAATGGASSRWKVGDDVYASTAKGSAPSWSTVRARFWKNEAASPGAAEKYGEVEKGTDLFFLL